MKNWIWLGPAQAMSLASEDWLWAPQSSCDSSLSPRSLPFPSRRSPAPPGAPPRPLPPAPARARYRMVVNKLVTPVMCLGPAGDVVGRGGVLGAVGCEAQPLSLVRTPRGGLGAHLRIAGQIPEGGLAHPCHFQTIPAISKRSLTSLFDAQASNRKAWIDISFCCSEQHRAARQA
jgi:hypothetical protein